MKVYILKYLYSARTVQFNTIANNEERVEMFTKKSELWGRIEDIEGYDSIYMDFDDLEYYEVDLSELDNSKL